ncbi:MAG: iron dicitrate transport regulator FecR [Gammaproteobacteria bacterium]|nr:MAG: iron dicitrate transport regulator FecR [Gammaproteobacteria bacterium]
MSKTKIQSNSSDQQIRQAIKAASQWYARFKSDSISQAEKQQWSEWLQASPYHQLAWQQVESVQSTFDQVPSSIASPVLQNNNPSRRELLRNLGIMAVVAPVAWLSYRHQPWQDWQVAYHTGIGEQQRVSLADGSLMVLNTDSAVDVEFSHEQRLVILHHGEVLINTAKDTGSLQSRPFSVKTPHGTVRALGTRFIVRSDQHHTQVTVLEKAVRIMPEASPSVEIQAGQSLHFSTSTLGAVTTADSSAGTWLQGSLIVLDMPLGQLLDELGRYQRGYLAFDDDISHLKVSGAFPLDDISRSLDVIEQSFPVRQIKRSRYWVKMVKK